MHLLRGSHGERLVLPSYQPIVPRSSARKFLVQNPLVRAKCLSPDVRPLRSVVSPTQKQSEGPVLKSACPLDDVAVPAVGEHEHRVKNCFCHHCKCGKHRCVVEKAQSLSCTNLSSYQAQFRGSRKNYDLLNCPIPNQHSLTHSGNPLEAETTHKHEFRKPAGSQPLRKSQSTRKNRLKHVSGSLYKRDYINWHHPGLIEKQPELPYRGNMVHFEGASTYNVAFKPMRPASKAGGCVRDQNPLPQVYSDSFVVSSHLTHARLDKIARKLNFRSKATGAKHSLASPPFRKVTEPLYLSEFTPKKSECQLPRGLLRRAKQSN